MNISARVTQLRTSRRLIHPLPPRRALHTSSSQGGCTMTIQWLLQWWNLIFAVPFGVALAYLGVYTLSGWTFGDEVELDHDLDHDIDADVDHDFEADAD